MSKPNTTGGGGMNPQEAQQAQTIAEMKRRHKYQDSVLETKLSYESGIFRDCHSDRERVLEIVDSQAQKIAEQAQTIVELNGDCERYDEALMIQGKNAAELRRQIVEQAKEIERLNQRSKLLQDIVDCALAMNSARKTNGKGPIDPNIDYFAKQLADFDSEVKP